MLSGFFCNVQGHIIANKFVVLAKVRHSQRMNDALIQVWIITAKDGTINCAHCLGCKAGLTESCSRIASVLFYLEAWTKVNGRLSCTQLSALGYFPGLPTRRNTLVSEILTLNPLKEMKADLDETIENLNEGIKVEVFAESPVQKPEVPVPTQAEMANFYLDLSK